MAQDGHLLCDGHHVRHDRQRLDLSQCTGREAGQEKILGFSRKQREEPREGSNVKLHSCTEPIGPAFWD